MLARPHPEHYLDSALTALSAGAGGHSMLDERPVPIYTTDAEGGVTYWNSACVGFAGRQPEHCRRLADATFDPKTSRVLGDMADGLDRIARQLGA